MPTVRAKQPQFIVTTRDGTSITDERLALSPEEAHSLIADAILTSSDRAVSIRVALIKLVARCLGHEGGTMTLGANRAVDMVQRD